MTREGQNNPALIIIKKIYIYGLRLLMQEREKDEKNSLGRLPATQSVSARVNK